MNADYKFIMNKQGKEVLFIPNTLLIKNNKGMSIKIVDEEGIKIISDKAITIQAKEYVTIASATKEIDILAPQNINMTQESKNIRLENNSYTQGAKVEVN